MKQRVPTWLGLGVLAMGTLVAALVALFAYTRFASPVFHTNTQDVGTGVATSVAEQEALAKANPGFLYGRVTTDAGAVYEGRLRWGGDQEAFWGDDFNGVKADNPWVAQVPSDALPKRERPFEIFGFSLGSRDRRSEFGRPFMARFGDIARIEAQRYLVRVTLKSGTVFNIDGLEATDFDDGVRVWSTSHGAAAPVDLASRHIRAIDFLRTARLGAAPARLHGTVRTSHGVFTGFLQWNREHGVGTDMLEGRYAGRKVSVRFDTIRSIARESSDSSRLTLADGRELVLSGTRDVGRRNQGVYVDDTRYGRVLVPWDAFERVDFSRDGSGPAYDDFPKGRPLSGTVTTRAGRRLSGRLVYDLDESETTDTLDAPSDGVDYTIPFGLVASIALPDGHDGSHARAHVMLQSGELLKMDLAGDLGNDNGGVLVFPNGDPHPEYVRWSDVKALEFARPAAMYPPAG